MTIEQYHMRSGNRTMDSSISHTRNRQGQSYCSHYTLLPSRSYREALRKLTDNAGGRSERHRELIQGSRIRDHDDLQTFLVFLRSHNPFSSDDPTQPRNISREVVADHRVNVDDALNIGAKIQERLTGKRFGDVTMKKKDQVQTFSIMRKTIKVDGEDVRMSPVQLYHQLLYIASTNGPLDPSIFSYEMTAVAPALFKEDGSMRTSQKSELAKHIVGKDPNITHKQYANSAGRVYDGCALIHRLAWPKVGTVGSVCETVVGYVQAAAAPDVHVCVVFDMGSYTDVVLEVGTPVPRNKHAFLGNMVYDMHAVSSSRTGWCSGNPCSRRR